MLRIESCPSRAFLVSHKGNMSSKLATAVVTSIGQFGWELTYKEREVWSGIPFEVLISAGAFCDALCFTATSIVHQLAGLWYENRGVGQELVKIWFAERAGGGRGGCDSCTAKIVHGNLNCGIYASSVVQLHREQLLWQPASC